MEQLLKKGVYPPEKIIPGEAYIGEMAKRGVIIKEKKYLWRTTQLFPDKVKEIL